MNNNNKLGEVNAHENAHKRSDVDYSPVSQHHTLGKNPNQAAPGNHIHAAVGDIKISAATSDHENWLLCDGAAVSRQYPLFILLGITFGAGDGVTTFNIPDEADLPDTLAASFNYFIYAGIPPIGT